VHSEIFFDSFSRTLGLATNNINSKHAKQEQEAQKVNTVLEAIHAVLQS
jgi:hypothetical protein